jgi:hypothetical protein
MADNILNAAQAVENRESYYNVIRTTGLGVTPFWETLGHGVSGMKSSAGKGYKWDYRPGAQAGVDNAHAEGARRADITSWNAVELSNQFQIFKKTSGITGSQAASFTKEEMLSSIKTQQMENMKQLRLDIEKALLSATAPVPAPTIATVRKMAGVKQYIPTSAVFDLVGAALSVKNHIDEAFKLMFLKGIVGEKIIVMCGPDVFTDLNWYYADKNLLKQTENAIMAKKDTISTGWHDTVRIMANPNMVSNEALVYAPSLINPVLLRSHKNKDVSDPNFDAEAREDLFELTLQVLDPYAAVHIKNIGRTV